MKPYLQELHHAARNLGLWVFGFFLFTFFLLFFGMKSFYLGDFTFVLPFPTAHSFAAQLFLFLQTFAPQGVPLIVTSPMEAFSVELQVASALSFAVLFPFFLFSCAEYFAPALLPRERRLLIGVLASSVVCFAAGVAFGLVLLAPALFSFFADFAPAIGATAFFSAREFVGILTSVAFSTGLAFLLPVAMALLSVLGIVPASFWGNRWREAVLIVAIASAIITPDGSGVGMALLSAPLVFLYGAGAVVGSRLSPRRRGRLSVTTS